MKNLYPKMIFLGLLLLSSFSFGASSFEGVYPIIASSDEGQIIFAYTNSTRTILGFVECELDPNDLEKPLLSLSPQGRRCLDLGSILNTPQDQDRFDRLFISKMDQATIQAGMGIHTVAYVASAVTGLLTAGYIGIGAGVGEGTIAFRQALPFVILTAVTAAVGYTLEQKALQRAHAEEVTLEFAIRHRKNETLKPQEQQDPEIYRDLKDSDLSKKIYQMFKSSISETLELMRIA